MGEGKREIMDILLEYCLTYAKCKMNHVHHAHKLTRGAKENDSHPIEYVPLISALWVAHTRHNIILYDATITHEHKYEKKQQ